jgi:hypothetical protein
MIRQLKLTSPSKLEETPPLPLPTSPPNKFRRTNKKAAEEETNATSEKNESIMSHETPPHSFARTTRLERREDSRNSSQIEDPFASKPINSRIKSEPEEMALRPNFIKKTAFNPAPETPTSPENEPKAVKALSPRANTGRPSTETALIQLRLEEKPKLTLKRSPALLFLLDRLVR